MTVIDVDELPVAGPEIIAAVRDEIRHDGFLSRATIERLTCDCDISRVITSGRSEIIDVGRTTRSSCVGATTANDTSSMPKPAPGSGSIVGAARVGRQTRSPHTSRNS